LEHPIREPGQPGAVARIHILETVDTENPKAAFVASRRTNTAEEVLDAVTSLDLDSLNDRAGSHSWGYVEPTEAAWELLEEAVEDIVADMKRSMDLGLETTAETICVGIVVGLHRRTSCMVMVDECSCPLALQSMGRARRRDIFGDLASGTRVSRQRRT
jgi:hypothetical protein